MRAPILVEPLGGDLVAIAQCHALDVSVFPHPSVPVIVTNERVLVARDEPGGPVRGFVATRPQGPWIEIVGLAVDEAHRGEGTGRALLRAAIAHARARDAAFVSLHVSTANLAAKSLYADEGFEVVRRIRRYYSPLRFADGGDAYLLVLELR